jgi:hypothetical protein
MQHILVRTVPVAALALLAGLAVAQTANLPTAAFEGRWVGVGVEPAPGARRQPRPEDRQETARSSLAFTAKAFTGPWGMSCANPRYMVLSVPPQGLFQGMFAGRDAADDADRMGFPEGGITTLRVDCANATFDFHLAGPRSLRFAFDGLIYLFERPPIAKAPPGGASGAREMPRQSGR